MNTGHAKAKVKPAPVRPGKAVSPVAKCPLASGAAGAAVAKPKPRQPCNLDNLTLTVQVGSRTVTATGNSPAGAAPPATATADQKALFAGHAVVIDLAVDPRASGKAWATVAAKERCGDHPMESSTASDPTFAGEVAQKASQSAHGDMMLFVQKYDLNSWLHALLGGQFSRLYAPGQMQRVFSFQSCGAPSASPVLPRSGLSALARVRAIDTWVGAYNNSAGFTLKFGKKTEASSERKQKPKPVDDADDLGPDDGGASEARAALKQKAVAAVGRVKAVYADLVTPKTQWVTLTRNGVDIIKAPETSEFARSIASTVDKITDVLTEIHDKFEEIRDWIPGWSADAEVSLDATFLTGALSFTYQPTMSTPLKSANYSLDVTRPGWTLSYKGTLVDAHVSLTGSVEAHALCANARLEVEVALSGAIDVTGLNVVVPGAAGRLPIVADAHLHTSAVADVNACGAYVVVGFELAGAVSARGGLAWTGEAMSRAGIALTSTALTYKFYARMGAHVQVMGGVAAAPEDPNADDDVASAPSDAFWSWPPGAGQLLQAGWCDKTFGNPP